MCKRCDRIKLLESKFSGPVFLFASGASSLSFDLGKYANHNFIVVNGAARKFLQDDRKFFAYVFTDESFVANSLELIKDCFCLAEFFFMPFEIYKKYLQEAVQKAGVEQKFFFINRVNRTHGEKCMSDTLFAIKSALDPKLLFDLSLLSAKKNKIGFSKDLAKGYFGSRTIAHIALQVIYYLGFEKVFLVGVDLSEAAGRFYDKDTSTALPTSLDKDYERFILPSFRFMADRVVDENFQVYNISEISRLPEAVVKKIKNQEMEKLLLA